MSEITPTVGSIRDLTDEVVSRTIDTLRGKLEPREIVALEALVAAGKFLDAYAILSAIAKAQDQEADSAHK